MLSWRHHTAVQTAVPRSACHTLAPPQQARQQTLVLCPCHMQHRLQAMRRAQPAAAYTPPYSSSSMPRLASASPWVQRTWQLLGLLMAARLSLHNRARNLLGPPSAHIPALSGNRGMRGMHVQLASSRHRLSALSQAPSETMAQARAQQLPFRHSQLLQRAPQLCRARPGCRPQCSRSRPRWTA